LETTSQSSTVLPNPTQSYKHHNTLSFHSVHEAVALRFVSFTFLDGEYNLADILSKHWGYQQVWIILKPILFFGGNTADLYGDIKVFSTFVPHPMGMMYILLCGTYLYCDQ